MENEISKRYVSVVNIAVKDINNYAYTRAEKALGKRITEAVLKELKEISKELEEILKIGVDNVSPL